MPISVKHIAFIAGSYQPDRCGVAHYTARLREYLAKHEINSTVLTTHAAANAANDATVHGVVNDWQWTNLITLVNAVKSTTADLLHIQHAAGSYGFQRAIFLLPLLLRLAGYDKPIVTTAHEYGWWEWQPAGIPTPLLEWVKQWGQERGWWDREDGFLLTGSQAILTTNANIAAIMNQRLPYLSDRIVHIPIGANVEVAPIERSIARQQLRQQFNWPEDTHVIAFFGFLHPVKGLETLLDAFEAVVAKVPTARLILIGGVESLALRGEEAKAYWDKLHTHVATLGLSESVKMTGYVTAETASRYLSGADIGVLPFNHGITLKSGSLLTLFAHGVPVIATRKELLDPDLDNENLITLIPPRNTEQLTHALLHALTDAEWRDRLSTTGKTFVQQFDWTAIVQKHLNIYANLNNSPA